MKRFFNLFLALIFLCAVVDAGAVSITTRSGKGSTLTHNELDANFKHEAVAKTGAYTVVESDNRATIEVSGGAYTMTLDDISTIVAASDTGEFEVTIKNTDASNNVTVARSGTDTIDGATSYTLTPDEAATFKVNQATDGWNVISTGLSDIATLTPTDSNVIVGDGTNWVAESGATARTSLGFTSAILDSTSVNIDGGAIDGTTIGANTPAAGDFTDLTMNGSSAFVLKANESQISFQDGASSTQWQLGERADSSNQFFILNGGLAEEVLYIDDADSSVNIINGTFSVTDGIESTDIGLTTAGDADFSSLTDLGSCDTGYSRAAPGLCVADDGIGTVIVSTMDSCTAIPSKTNATAVLIRAYVEAGSANSGGTARGTQAYANDNASCTNPVQVIVADSSAWEFSAVTAGVKLDASYGQAIISMLPTDFTHVWCADDAGNEGVCQIYLPAYWTNE